MDYETEHYKIIVAENKEASEVYHIVNRVTGVTEYEDYLLPRAIDTLMELQDRLTEVLQKFNGPKLSVIEESKDGKVGIH